MSPVNVAVTQDSVIASANYGATCALYRYSFASKATTTKLLGRDGGSCSGLVVTGSNIYVIQTKLSSSEVRHWSSWDNDQPGGWPIGENETFVYLGFDVLMNRLLAATSDGNLNAISISTGKPRRIASDMGWVNSIATDQKHILLASGKKILSISQITDKRETTPTGLNSLGSGHISGLVFDAAGRIWLCDYDKCLIRGPLTPT